MKSSKTKSGQRGGAQGEQQRRVAFIVQCIVIVVVASVCTMIFAPMILYRVFDVRSFRKEQAVLKGVAQSLETQAPAETIDSAGPTDPGQSDISDTGAFDEEMRQINPDYICWMTIDGTVVDYPVVRGEDNEKYLDLSFSGEKNMLGSLFMDYRCEGKYVPHIIVYGHNSSQGDMFGSLWMFLDEGYRKEHSKITLKVNDRTVVYEIFSARQTDVNDPAYFLDFNASGSFGAFADRCGAPINASQIITLSTCVSGGDDDERVVVQGVLA